MAKESKVTDGAKQYITQKLREVESEENVKIIMAIESGSRAWGFPSKDSDYDIRFLYVRNKDDYLTVNPIRDVIEAPIVDDDYLGVKWDMNGWDIKKALNLATKSNLTLNEWLNSPIHYIYDEESVAKLKEFTRESYHLDYLISSYHHWANGLWKDMDKSVDTIKIKSYCYIIRLLFVANWAKANQANPPMDMYSLHNGLTLEQSLISILAELIEQKSKSSESDLVGRNKIIDEYITASLQDKIEKQNMTQIDEGTLSKANQLFRELLSR